MRTSIGILLTASPRFFPYLSPSLWESAPLLIKASPGGEKLSPSPETIPLPFASRKFAFTAFDTDNNAPYYYYSALARFRALSRVDSIDRLSMLHSAEFIQRRNPNFSGKRFNTAAKPRPYDGYSHPACRWENIFPPGPRPVKSLSATKYVHYRGTRNISLFRIEKLGP